MAADPKPIDACKGWETPCPFCDKRFEEWKEPEDESFFLEVPEKPILFMFALESKQKTQVVYIGVIEANSQQELTKKFQYIRETISQRRSKDSKSTIKVRWMVVNKMQSKETSVVFGHWFNYGILPKMIQKCPGLDLLPGHFEFSEANNKWCYPSKEATWRKPKKTPTVAKAVKRCNWSESCPFCDARFTQWTPLKEYLERKTLPAKPGFYMFAQKNGSRYQVIYVDSSTSLHDGVGQSWRWIRNSRLNPNEDYEGILVRWLVHGIENEDSCFVYAHWLNCGDQPIFNNKTYSSDTYFGERVLLKSKNFVLRNTDLQWCFESEERSKPIKMSKTKEKRYVEQSIQEELLDL